MLSPEFRPIRLVLADDHALVRTGIRALLNAMPGVEVVGEARDGEELLTLLQGVQPDVVLLDISMPRMDGITALAQLRERHPGIRVVVLSMYDSVDFVKRAVAHGASGYLLKNAPPAELERALRSVMASGSYFGPAIALRLLQRQEVAAEEVLTERQLDILKRIAQGHSAKEIGFALGLSSKTVDVHRARIMDRLQLADVASLTRYAIRHGLVAA